MSVTIITLPTSLVSTADAKLWAPVLAEDSDARVAALLAVAQAAIEPPNGWVGRAFGVQTLEARFAGFCGSTLALPCPPLRKVVSVTYVDEDGQDVVLAPSAYRVTGIGAHRGAISIKRGASWPAASFEDGGVKVQFEAGYADDDPQVLPVKHAIVLGATHLRSLSSQDLSLRSRDVVGVGSRTWTVSDAAEKLVRSAVDALLMPLRVYA